MSVKILYIIQIYIFMYGMYIFYTYTLPYLCVMQYFYMYASSMSGFKRKVKILETRVMEIVVLLIKRAER